MTQVLLGENEQLESALRRFKRKVSQAGIFTDMKKNRHFETPGQKRKRKEIAKHKQRRRQNNRGRFRAFASANPTNRSESDSLIDSRSNS
jgi:small subunit ribosomal protein S21